jgi:hypothetical protein
LTLRQYQTFAQSLGAYKRQIQAISAATEVFVRALQDLADCVPQANIQDPLLITDLDFLIDSSQLMSNAHQNWASMLEREVEEPLLTSISQIPKESKLLQESNKLKIQDLIQKLHQEEDYSYKIKKQKRNLELLQNSLNHRMELAEEIKKLSFQNDHIHDIKSQERVAFILNTVSRAVEAKLEAFETIQEGFGKIGAVMDENQKEFGKIGAVMDENQKEFGKIGAVMDGNQKGSDGLYRPSSFNPETSAPKTELFPPKRDYEAGEVDREFIRHTMGYLK